MSESLLDKKDLQILEILQANGRIPIVELAERVSLSPTPCAVRVKRMEADGIIKGYTVKTDREKLGLAIMAIILVRLKENTTEAGEEFSEAMKMSTAIHDCFITLGRIDYVIHVYAQDLSSLEDVIRKDVASLPHILSLETILVLGSKGNP